MSMEGIQTAESKEYMEDLIHMSLSPESDAIFPYSSPVPKNDPMEIRYRKYAYNMVIGGLAVIAFGVWSVIKTVLYLTLQGMDPEGLLEEAFAADFAQWNALQMRIFNVVLAGIIIMVLIFDLLARLYVGRSAIIDAQRKKKKSPLYIILSAYMGFTLLIGLFTGQRTVELDAASQYVKHAITASGIVDVTSFLAFLELTCSSVAARRLRAKIAAKEMIDCGRETAAGAKGPMAGHEQAADPAGEKSPADSGQTGRD